MATYDPTKNFATKKKLAKGEIEDYIDLTPEAEDDNEISQLEAKVSEGDLSNVIHKIWWELVARDQDDDMIAASTMGILKVSYNPDDPFIPYEDLTKDDVIGWLESGLDVENLKSELDARINEQKNPTDIYLNPNWN